MELKEILAISGQPGLYKFVAQSVRGVIVESLLDGRRMNASANAKVSRHRGAKLRRRCELLGGISLLSPEYLLSVERWPFHSGPPDHYDRLSSLLEPSLSQSGWLMPLHSTIDFRPI